MSEVKLSDEFRHAAFAPGVAERGRLIGKLRDKVLVVLRAAEMKLPCDVLVAPATIIRKGCELSTLLASLSMREGRDDYMPFTDAALQAIRPPRAFESPSTTEALEAERFQHVKRGTTYVRLGEAELQCSEPAREGEVLTVYRADHGGKLWARPSSEFEDGRFIPLNRARKEGKTP